MLIDDELPIDWMHARETRMLVAGPVGSIEVVVNGVEKPRALALISHPHPLHGGDLDNKVVFTLARACRDVGVIAVRFNFRGVGRSGGIHDGGVGELLDAQALLVKIQSGLPDLPVLLAGFSFGAAIALQLAASVNCAGVILVAPPVPRYGLGSLCLCTAPMALLQCEDDEVVDSVIVGEWFEKIICQEKLLQCWPIGGHFFHGMLPELKGAVEDFLSRLLIGFA